MIFTKVITVTMTVIYMTLPLSSGRVQDGLNSTSAPSTADPTFPAMFTNRRPPYDPYRKIPTTTEKLPTGPTPPPNCCSGQQKTPWAKMHILVHGMLILLIILLIMLMILNIMTEKVRNNRRRRNNEKNTLKVVKMIAFDLAPPREPAQPTPVSYELFLSLRSLQQIMKNARPLTTIRCVANIRDGMVIDVIPEDEMKNNNLLNSMLTYNV